MASELHSALRDPEQHATLAFLAVKGVGAVTCVRLRKKFGSLAAAIEAGPAHYMEFFRGDAREEHDTRGSLDGLAEEIVADCEKRGVHILFRGAPGWPKSLEDLGDGEPELLFVRGTLAERAHAVAVVGTRQADTRGVNVATRIGQKMAEAGVLVVSGGALGIDAASHQGALIGKGPTWAVLGGGFKRLYPPQNRELFEKIVAEGGALISETPPQHEVKGGLFPRRNQIVAALSQATVVVQGGENSGAMLTAQDVLKLNKANPERLRTLLAVPGDVADASAAGPHLLLRMGAARACWYPTDLLRALGLMPALDFPKDGETASEPELEPTPAARATPLDASLEPVFRAIEAAPKHFDALASQVRWPAPELLAALTQLELLGMVEQKPGKFFVRKGG
ncbi:MAG: DNA-processing protein DprA [Deltaproteobacteria bacterium]|nr:DNA-processing protein DprA [Deltaproteobacteria bacterium]